MTFQTVLATLPSIDGITKIEILDGNKIIHQIPAIEGKLGSLKVYNALAQQFGLELDSIAAQQGLIWFAEHTQNAKENQGKHPNIDLLFQIIEQNQRLKLRIIKSN